ncbi:MAG: prepilin-type N-terminal cleavage/methylation domain-containing protein [Puniceicoccales bacterium]|jgi:prepilin-type N-terminal cleavage/methylation domain-containing protein|nr:prepilin-type N-terminal cleavage/methylation domain-containing protein [Puniceicoccales bacterium]
MSFKNSRPGVSLVEVVIAAAVVGLLAALCIGPIKAAVRNGKENSMRENLQQIWISANAYFLKHETSEVSWKDLTNSEKGDPAVANLKPVVSEDYSSVNDGKITSADKKLELTYYDGSTSRTVAYEVGK